MTIKPVNDPSVLEADTKTVFEDTVAVGNVLTNDSDVDDVLTVTSFTVAGLPGRITSYNVCYTKLLRNATLVESLTALETIKTQGAESVMQNKWEKSVAFVARVNNQMRFLSAAATNGAMEVQQLVNVLVVIGGVYLISEGMLSMGGLIACTMLSSRAVAPLGQVVGLLMQYHNAIV